MRISSHVAREKHQITELLLSNTTITVNLYYLDVVNYHTTIPVIAQQYKYSNNIKAIFIISFTKTFINYIVHVNRIWQTIL